MNEVKIIELILDELKKAEQKHEFPCDVIHQVSIMNEEAGESIRAALHYVYEDGSVENLRKELIQTAAMCIRCLKNGPNTDEELVFLANKKNKRRLKMKRKFIELMDSVLIILLFLNFIGIIRNIVFKPKMTSSEIIIENRYLYLCIVVIIVIRLIIDKLNTEK